MFIMWAGQAIIQIALSTMLFLAECGSEQLKKTTILNGSQLPQDQGWLVSNNAIRPFNLIIDDKILTLNTIGVLRDFDQRPGKAFMWFYKEVPFNFDLRFSIEFTLKVHKVEQAHNLHDSGIMFYGSTRDPSGDFSGGPRSQMIFFDENAIGWGDETERFAMDTTDRFHTYTLKVSDKE